MKIQLCLSFTLAILVASCGHDEAKEKLQAFKAGEPEKVAAGQWEELFTELKKLRQTYGTSAARAEIDEADTELRHSYEGKAEDQFRRGKEMLATQHDQAMELLAAIPARFPGTPAEDEAKAAMSEDATQQVARGNRNGSPADAPKQATPLPKPANTPVQGTGNPSQKLDVLPQKMDIKEISSAYSSNTFKADEKYKGRVFSITGKVDRVSRTFENKVEIDVDAGVGGIGNEVRCNLRDDTEGNKAKKLDKGDPITVVGIFVRGSTWIELSDVIIQ